MYVCMYVCMYICMTLLYYYSRGDQVHISNQLLYHVMSILKSNTSDKVFELVVDLTQASSVNEPDVSTILALALALSRSPFSPSSSL